MADRTVTVRLLAANSQYNAEMAKSAVATQALNTSTGRMATAGAQSMERMGRSVSAMNGPLRDARGRFVATEQAVRGTGAALGAAEVAAGKASSRFAGMGDKARKFSTDVVGINPRLLGAGGLIAGLVMTSRAAIKWESAFTGVKKTVSGTPEQLQSISDGLQDMSKQIPTSANDLAGIAESAGQLGIETDNVLEFTRVIADLGETTNLSGEEGATTLARFANITQMAQGDFERLGSVIVHLGNNFETTESEIANMGLRLAGAGAQVGMTEADILGIAAALSSVGIEAEAGGTAVSKTMIEIAREVELGGDKLATFAEVAGMSVDEFVAAWRDDASGALGAFVTGLGTVEERGGSLIGVLDELEISEARQSDAMRRMAGAGDLFTEATSGANAEWAEANALSKEAAQRYETVEAKIEIAKNAMTIMAAEIGEVLLPIIADAAEATAAWFDMKPPSWLGDLTHGEAITKGVQSFAGQFGLTDDYDKPFDQSGRRDDFDSPHRSMEFGADGTWQSTRPRHEAMQPNWSRVNTATGQSAGVTGAAGRTHLNLYEGIDTSRLQTVLEDEVKRLAREGLGPIPSGRSPEGPDGFGAAIGPSRNAPDLSRIEAATDTLRNIGEGVDWSRIEKGTSVFMDLKLLGEEADLIMRNLSSPDPDWSRVEDGATAFEDVETASDKALEKTHAASHPGADWSRIEAGTQVLDTQGFAAEDAQAKIEGYLEILQGTTDPMFALKNALDGVDEAQRDYNEAVKEHGEGSAEAQDAAFNLAAAVSTAEQAAINGELSFEDFNAKLDQWVDMGVITGEQADALRGRVKELRGEAENFDGGYEAQLEAWTDEAQEKIKATTAEAETYDRRYVATFGTQTAAAIERIRRLKAEIAGIDRTINIRTTVTNQGEVAANIPGKGRILMHSGGVVSNSPTGWMPGLSTDERLRVLQVGETVVPAAGRTGGMSTTSNDNRTLNVYGTTTPHQRWRARRLLATP